VSTAAKRGLWAVGFGTARGRARCTRRSGPVFDFGGPIVGEAVLDTGAHHPAPAGFIGSRRGERVDFVLVVREGGAAPAVEQEAIKREAEPACKGAERVYLPGQFAGTQTMPSVQAGLAEAALGTRCIAPGCRAGQETHATRWFATVTLKRRATRMMI
jgi:hypothetical protein